MAEPRPGQAEFRQGLWRLVLTRLHAWVHRRLGLPPHPPSVPTQAPGGL